MPDSSGITRLLPQYFGVLRVPRPRPRPFPLAGRHALGQHHQAADQILRTEVGGASDRLCQSEELTDLGLACTL
jgi:hypothetical protein